MCTMYWKIANVRYDIQYTSGVPQSVHIVYKQDEHKEVFQMH